MAIPQVVGAICGVHAQVMAATELSIGLRTEGVTRVDVRQALWTDHSLIKTAEILQGTADLTVGPMSIGSHL